MVRGRRLRQGVSNCGLGLLLSSLGCHPFFGQLLALRARAARERAQTRAGAQTLHPPLWKARCVRQMRPPGRGDCWILKIAHAPSPKNLSKNGFCPREGVAFLRKAFLQKNFQVLEKIPLSALAFAYSHALVPRRLRTRQPHCSLISGLLGLEGISKRKDSHCRSGQGALGKAHWSQWQGQYRSCAKWT
jgi:hypothetical protein